MKTTCKTTSPSGKKLWSKYLKKSTAKDRETELAKLERNRAKAEKLFGKTNGCGMIIGEIVMGNIATYEGLLGIPVLEFKLWPESEWIKSPGGLGVRHMPEKKGK